MFVRLSGDCMEVLKFSSILSKSLCTCVHVNSCVCLAATPYAQRLHLSFHLPQEPLGTPRTLTFF